MESKWTLGDLLSLWRQHYAGKWIATYVTQPSGQLKQLFLVVIEPSKFWVYAVRNVLQRPIYLLGLADGREHLQRWRARSSCIRIGSWSIIRLLFLLFLRICINVGILFICFTSHPSNCRHFRNRNVWLPDENLFFFLWPRILYKTLASFLLHSM